MLLSSNVCIHVQVVERDEDECPVSPPADPQGSARLFNATPHPITSVGKDPDSVQLVVNELVVDRGPHPYLCNLELYCNGRFMTSVQGDGEQTLTHVHSDINSKFILLHNYV